MPRISCTLSVVGYPSWCVFLPLSNHEPRPPSSLRAGVRYFMCYTEATRPLHGAKAWPHGASGKEKSLPFLCPESSHLNDITIVTIQWYNGEEQMKKWPPWCANTRGR